MLTDACSLDNNTVAQGLVLSPYGVARDSNDSVADGEVVVVHSFRPLVAFHPHFACSDHPCVVEKVDHWFVGMAACFAKDNCWWYVRADTVDRNMRMTPVGHSAFH